jgi:replicative DNA helicase
LKRCLIKFGYKVVNSGYITNISLENTLLKVEKELFTLTNEIRRNKTVNTAQVLNELFSELKNKFLNPQLPGLPSGLSKLDELTQGFQKSDLIIIAGRPSMGKTALSLNIALNCIKISRLPILFCSLEMSKEQILYRLLSSETGINQMQLRSGKLTSNDWIKLNKVMRIISKLPFFIDDTSNLSTQEIRSKIKTIILEQSQIGLVIIDYLQLMQGLNFKQANRVQELSQITRDLKGLAREFNVPIIALSQLSRNVDNRIDQRPILSDLRESGSIEQDADLILMLYGSKPVLQMNSSSLSTNQRTKSAITELIIAKQRNGPTGTVKLEFNQDKIQFSESEVNLNK